MKFEILQLKFLHSPLRPGVSFLVFVFFLGPLQAQTVSDYFKKFPGKPESINIDNPDEHTRVTVDTKNAYIKVSYDDADYSYEYGGEVAFTYFVKADKQKIFGYTEFFEGPSSSSASIQFFQLEKDKWHEVSVLPDLSLTDFDSTSAMVDSVGSEYNIQYTLPQQGTDIKANVLEVGENNTPFDYATYLDFIRKLPELTLKWNKLTGMFEIKKD